MAERLPRYRPLGVSIPSIPGVDAGAPMRAQASVFGGVSDALDKMSEFAFKRAEQRAQIAGAQYGAGRAPSAQQLKDAGKDLAEYMVPGDQETVFGQAARTAALAAMETELEIAARREIANIKINAELKNTPVTDMSDQIDAVIDGYGETLMGVSPAAALKFRASVATYGNSQVTSYAGDLIKKQEEAAQIQALEAIDLITVNDLDALFSNGSTFANDDQPYVGLKNKINDLRDKIFSIGAGVRDKELIKGRIKIFDERVSQLFVGQASDYGVMAPGNLAELSGAMGKDIDGIADVLIRDLWANMTDKQRRDAVKETQQRIRDDASTEAALDAQRARDRAQRSNELRADIMDARLKGEPTEELLAEMREVDPKLYSELAGAITSAGGIDDAVTVTDLQLQSVNRTLTIDDITSAMRAGRLTVTTAKQLMEKVDAHRKEDHANAMKVVRARFGFPDVGLINPGLEKMEEMQKIADIEAQLIMEATLDPGLNRMSRAMQLIEEKLKSTEQKELDGNEVLAEGRGYLSKPNATIDEVRNYFLSDQYQSKDKLKKIEALQKLGAAQ